MEVLVVVLAAELVVLVVTTVLELVIVVEAAVDVDKLVVELEDPDWYIQIIPPAPHVVELSPEQAMLQLEEATA